MSLFEGVWTEAKPRQYIYVWFFLGFMTIAEIAVVFMPIPHLIIGLSLTLMASIKAATVGYYYMHLNHETRWLRFVACLPLIAVMYAAVLMIEVGHRPISAYLPENPRVFPKEHGHGGEAGEAEKAAEEEAEVVVHSGEAPPSPTAAPALAPIAPAAASAMNAATAAVPAASEAPAAAAAPSGALDDPKSWD